MLAVSEEAASAIGSILAAQDLPDEAGLRVSADPAGADGAAQQTALRLEIAPAPTDGDQVLEEGPVFVEPEAADLLDDKVLDAEVRGDQIQFSVKAQK